MGIDFGKCGRMILWGIVDVNGARGGCSAANETKRSETAWHQNAKPLPRLTGYQYYP